MNKVKHITHISQRIFIIWVKNQYDTGVFFRDGLQEGIYESFVDIIEKGTYESKHATILNRLLKNTLTGFKKHIQR